MSTAYITTNPSKVNHSPFSREENLALGQTEGEQLIVKARMFKGYVHISQLRRLACGDLFAMNHLLDTADAWDVKVHEE
jgi:hypothetical protein